MTVPRAPAQLDLFFIIECTISITRTNTTRKEDCVSLLGRSGVPFQKLESRHPTIRYARPYGRENVLVLDLRIPLEKGTGCILGVGDPGYVSEILDAVLSDVGAHLGYKRPTPIMAVLGVRGRW